VIEVYLVAADSLHSGKRRSLAFSGAALTNDYALVYLLF
jgi:hypothetical protein